MSPNSIHPPLNGAAESTDEGFARRRVNDLAGLLAIASTVFLVALLTGVDTPAFAVVLLGAISALVYGETRLRGTVQSPRTAPAFGTRHVRA
jgi:hypothetical protein